LAKHSPALLHSNKNMPGPLDGIIVADFSRVLAGPYASMLLADFGATVIKVEHPDRGDDTRTWGPPFTAEGKATYFESVNRNKRSIALNFTDATDVGRARTLVNQSDVVIQNFKVGALNKFALDYDSVSATNSRVIYCSISGFGSKAGKDLPGYDLLIQAMGGLMSITGTDQPTKVGVALVDVLCGLHASNAVMAALIERGESGLGQHLEVNLLSVLLSSMVNQSSAYALGGVTPGLLGNAHPSIAPYEVFDCSDRSIVIAVGNDTQFTYLCNALGLCELAVDSRFATNPNRVANRELLHVALSTVLKTQSADYWYETLNKCGVPCGPINSIPQAFALAEQLGLRPVHEGMVANPVDFSRTPVQYRLSPPELGASTQEVISQFGLDN
jgi:crotonobetainyl-CoA:carnitine CoA-transferase CaiB-like acyl-CoA transferase